MQAEAEVLARGIADTFQLEGLLAVELFVTTYGELWSMSSRRGRTTVITPASAPA